MPRGWLVLCVCCMGCLIEDDGGVAGVESGVVYGAEGGERVVILCLF